MSAIQRDLATRGALALSIVRAAPANVETSPFPVVIDDRNRLDLKTVRRYAMPQKDLPAGVNEYRTRNLRDFQRGFRRAALAKTLGIPTHFGSLFASLIRGNGEVVDLGLLSLRVVTDNGVAFIADAFTNTVEAENMNFHGMGTGTTAEAAADTALVTELTTEYNPNSTRATGTQTSPSNVYQTVGTNTIDSGTPAITEHGIFSQAATGGGTLLDRSKFTAINLVSGDGIQFTYQLTFTSGG